MAGNGAMGFDRVSGVCEAGQTMTSQERARNILTLLNLPADYDPRNGIPKGSYDAVLAEIAEAEREAVLEKFEGDDCAVAQLEMAAYERGRNDVLAIYEAKWSTGDYFKGFHAAREKAAGIVIKYRNEGQYETGHRFMTDLDDVAGQIRAMEANHE